MLTDAIVALLAHKTHIMNISKKASYRHKETISWLNSKNSGLFFEKYLEIYA